MFELRDGRLWSTRSRPGSQIGHWTPTAASRQFEQHVRAIAGWPLGPTDSLARTEMINLSSDELEQPKLAAEASARVWLYGKGEAGRAQDGPRQPRTRSS